MTDEVFYRRVFGLVLLLLIGSTLLTILRPFVEPLAWALLLSFLLYPVNRRLRQKLKGGRGRAALVLTFTVLLVLAIPSALLVVALAREAVHLAQQVYATAPDDWVASRNLFDLPILKRALQWTERTLPIEISQLQTHARALLDQALQFVATASGTILVGAVTAAGKMLLTLFILFFALRDGEMIADTATALVPLETGRKRDLVGYLADVTRAVVLGSVVTAIAQGTLVGVAFAILGMPSPLVFGAVSALVSTLPVGGTALVWLPGAVALAVQGRWVAAGFLVGWGVLVVSTVDNFIRPTFVSGRSSVPTLAVFLGIIGGIATFGLLGALLGPVVVALALALIRYFRESTDKPVSDVMM